MKRNNNNPRLKIYHAPAEGRPYQLTRIYVCVLNGVLTCKKRYTGRPGPAFIRILDELDEPEGQTIRCSRTELASLLNWYRICKRLNKNRTNPNPK